MRKISDFFRSRLNSGAWALAVLVIIEVLINFLSESLTIVHLTPNEVLLPRSYLYTYWVASSCCCWRWSPCCLVAERSPPAALGDLRCQHHVYGAAVPSPPCCWWCAWRKA